jgi:hypothetical protein
VYTIILLLLTTLSTPALSEPHAHQGIAPKFVGKPDRTPLTEADEATLLRGESVLKQVKFDGGGRGIAVLDIQAPQDRVWSVITDYPNYPNRIEQMEEAEVYGRTADHIFVRFVLGAFLVEVEYYINHTYRPREGYLTWELDYSRKSDLDDSVGYWLVYPTPGREGFTRVEYSCDLRLSGWVPGIIEDLLANQGLTLSTNWVKRDAEGE